jgi:hypothetical protein
MVRPSEVEVHRGTTLSSKQLIAVHMSVSSTEKLGGRQTGSTLQYEALKLFWQIECVQFLQSMLLHVKSAWAHHLFTV